MRVYEKRQGLSPAAFVVDKVRGIMPLPGGSLSRGIPNLSALDYGIQ
jgi:hypothetical protein